MPHIRMPRFLRRFFRRKMHPMQEYEAAKTKHRISLLYAFLAWNAGGYVVYQIMSGNKYWPTAHGVKQEEEELPSPSYKVAKMLGIQNAQVRRIGVEGYTEIRPKQD